MLDSSVVNALSFDVEDWFHILGSEDFCNVRHWPHHPSLVTRYTERILGILDEQGVRATFFILGWIAQRYPHISRLIASQGHEIGTHSYWHRPVRHMTPREFREDLTRAVAVVEQQTGHKVRGFRAPGFSITPDQAWAFDIMLDLGLEYDASLVPFSFAGPSYPCSRSPHVVRDAPSGRTILELPVSVLRMGPLGLRFSGGGYLRLLPSSLIRWAVRRQNRRRLPVVVYLHPRDLAIDCPRVKMPLSRRFRCYVGLASAERKLRMLCSEFRFGSCLRVLRAQQLIDTTAPLVTHLPEEPSIQLASSHAPT